MRLAKAVFLAGLCLGLPAAAQAQSGPPCPTMVNPTPSHPATAIVFGAQAYEQTSIVWVQALSGSGNSAYLCSGTLIGKNRVLTAAHCVCPGCTLSVGFGPKAFPDSRDKIVTNVTNVAMHPQFQFSGLDMQPGHDLAVLTVANYSSCAPYATPMPIFTIGSIVARPAGKFTIVGYGLTELGSAGEKKKANVAMSSATCTQDWARRSGCVGFAEFVLEGSSTTVSSSLGADTCNGDSGGPALFIAENGDRALAGVTSRALVARGAINNQGCGLGGIYEYVGIPAVLTWLHSVVPDLIIANR